MNTMTRTDIATKLSSKNVRPSLQRMAVYEYLVSHPTHPTVDIIYNELVPNIPTLSKTTVYNTLKQLIEAELIQSVTIEDGELRFDADTSNHLHFKCTKCEKVFDIFTSIELPQTTLPTGFTATKVQTNIWGICLECNK